MKNLLFSFVLLLSAFDGSSQVTNVDSFYLPGSVWLWEGHLQSSHDCSRTFYRYKIERDSTINGMNYHLISGQDLARGSGGCGPLQLMNNDYGIFGGIRVDDRKVYFLLFDTVSTVGNLYDLLHNSWQEGVNYAFQIGVEEILYDFDLNVGDSLAWKPTFHVHDIDSTGIGGIYIKRYSFHNQNSSNGDSWLEGIGSGFNLLSTRWGAYRWVQLKCYQGAYGGFGQIGFNSYCSKPYLSVNEKKLPSLTLIHPNPITGDILTISNEGGSDITSVVIYDISGKLCEQHTINSPKQELRLSVQTGLYFVRINYEDGTHAVQKLTKL